MKLFGKKEETPGKTVPVDEVNRLMQQGLSDKDTIKQLKAEGYSYSEIEKAMLSAVKGGVVSSPQPIQPLKPVQSPQPINLEPIEPLPPSNIEEPVSFDNPVEETPTTIEPELPAQDQMIADEENDADPELAIEELIESIVDEKWNDIEKRMDRIEGQNQDIREDIQVVKKQFETMSDRKVNDYSEDINDIKRKFDDFDIRVSALEKAFKQFLPSLTENIEELSNIVKDIKRKQDRSY